MSTSLPEVARRTDKAVADARSELERAVRRASLDGMSQSQIAREIGRSQPEVSRLLHFHGSSPLARRLRRHAREIRDAVAEAGGSDVRVFGSLATGRENSNSDVDLLFTMGPALSLMQLSVLENRVAEILGSEVDLVPDSALRPDLRERILAEAVPL
ncbi:MAG: nucleotidyltransferase domain-containing protein [Acidipropionibacterium sp.]|jgi:predicted nucleotidyltransferase|nr:nucleotidyltransferase domain-containing protein [Acidipropionibacterium sp.]